MVGEEKRGWIASVVREAASEWYLEMTDRKMSRAFPPAFLRSAEKKPEKTIVTVGEQNMQIERG